MGTVYNPDSTATFVQSGGTVVNEANTIDADFTTSCLNTTSSNDATHQVARADAIFTSGFPALVGVRKRCVWKFTGSLIADGAVTDCDLELAILEPGATVVKTYQQLTAGTLNLDETFYHDITNRDIDDMTLRIHVESRGDGNQADAVCNCFEMYIETYSGVFIAGFQSV